MVTHTHIYTHTHTHIHIHTHNRNIWPSATPTANQYKHMAQRHIIETYGPQPNNRNIWPYNSQATVFCHAWPILLSVFQVVLYTLLSYNSLAVRWVSFRVRIGGWLIE